MTSTHVDRKDLAAMLRRSLRAIEENNGHAADLLNSPRTDFHDLLVALGHLDSVRHSTERAIATLVRVLVEEDASWRQIGDALSVTKQAAQKRYGSTLVDRKLPGL